MEAIQILEPVTVVAPVIGLDEMEAVGFREYFLFRSSERACGDPVLIKFVRGEEQFAQAASNLLLFNGA